jgi:hypothetical protein
MTDEAIAIIESDTEWNEQVEARIGRVRDYMEFNDSLITLEEDSIYRIHTLDDILVSVGDMADYLTAHDIIKRRILDKEMEKPSYKLATKRVGRADWRFREVTSGWMRPKEDGGYVCTQYVETKKTMKKHRLKKKELRKMRYNYQVIDRMIAAQEKSSGCIEQTINEDGSVTKVF